MQESNLKLEGGRKTHFILQQYGLWLNKKKKRKSNNNETATTIFFI